MGDEEVKAEAAIELSAYPLLAVAIILCGSSVELRVIKARD